MEGAPPVWVSVVVQCVAGGSQRARQVVCCHLLQLLLRDAQLDGVKRLLQPSREELLLAVAEITADSLVQKKKRAGEVSSRQQRCRRVAGQQWLWLGCVCSG